MWIQRDLSKSIRARAFSSQPVKILVGPRQVGKTSLLAELPRYELISFDDLQIRQLAQENPRFFLDQFQDRPLILDEASYSPNLFPEIKRRVDEEKRLTRRSGEESKIDYWVTGSNQTLLQNHTQESLVGRASFFSLNTLSIHELGYFDLPEYLIKGGWPELYANTKLKASNYLNEFVSTYLNRDIAQAAGIEKQEAFLKTVGLLAGRVGQLINFSEIASLSGVESTTIQSWVRLIEQNGLVCRVPAFSNNLNKRLIKSPKVYFEDVGLAARLQGWTDYLPLSLSPYFGLLVENLAFTEIKRFFSNSLLDGKIFFVRDKDRVEVDFLLELPNQRFIVAEVKTTPREFSWQQKQLIEALKLNVVENWIISPKGGGAFQSGRSLAIADIYPALQGIC